MNLLLKVPIAFLLVAGCTSLAEKMPQQEEKAASSAGASSGEAQSAGPLLETKILRSELLAKNVTYHLYLPPSYDSSPARSYPVVYWLHGSGGYPPGIVEMLAARFDSAIASGRMPEAIVVFPDGFQNTLWINAKDGSNPVEDFLVRELLKHVDTTYRTRGVREGRVIEGASMGGYGAARLGFLYPELFGGVSMINPGPMQRILDPDNAPIAGRALARATLERVFGGDSAHFVAQSPWTLAGAYADKDAPELRIRMILGENDPIAPTNLQFAKRLDSLGIAHEVVMVPSAGHNPGAMFAGLADEYWAFFAQAFQDGPRDASPPQ